MPPASDGHTAQIYAGQGVIGLVAATALEPLSPVLVLTMQDDIIADARRATTHLDHRRLATGQRQFGDLLVGKAADDLFQFEDLRC